MSIVDRQVLASHAATKMTLKWRQRISGSRESVWLARRVSFDESGPRWLIRLLVNLHIVGGSSLLSLHDGIARRPCGAQSAVPTEVAIETMTIFDRQVLASHAATKMALKWGQWISGSRELVWLARRVSFDESRPETGVVHLFDLQLCSFIGNSHFLNTLKQSILVLVT